MSHVFLCSPAHSFLEVGIPTSQRVQLCADESIFSFILIIFYEELNVLYKLANASEVPDDAWKTRGQWMQAFGDMSAKCIQLYTHDNLAAAAAAEAFAGKADVMLLSFTTETMEQEADLQIKEEDGAINAYGGVIPFACLYAPP